MLSAVFLSGCNTVHEYKEKIKALSESDRACLNFTDYEIFECFHMKYEDYIYLCNHLNERFIGAKKVRGGGAPLSVSMFFNSRADKVLLVSFDDFKVAVL